MPFLKTEDQTNSSTLIPHAAMLASSSTLTSQPANPINSSVSIPQITSSIHTNVQPEESSNSTSILTPEVANSDVPPPQATNITCFAILPPDTAFVYYPVITTSAVSTSPTSTLRLVEAGVFYQTVHMLIFSATARRVQMNSFILLFTRAC